MASPPIQHRARFPWRLVRTGTRLGATLLARPRVRFLALFALALMVLVVLPPLLRMRAASGAPSAPELPLDAVWVNTAGDPPSLAALRGKVVILWFWRASDEHSLRALDEIRQLHACADPARVVVLCIHGAKFPGESSSEAVALAAARLGISFPVLVDGAGTAARTYGFAAWPTCLVIGPEGNIFAQGQGIVTAAELRAASEQAFGEAGRGSPQWQPRAAPGPSRDASPRAVCAVPPSADAPGFLAVAFSECVSIRAYPDGFGSAPELWRFCREDHGQLARPAGFAYDPASQVLHIASEGGHALIGLSLRSREVVYAVSGGDQPSRPARPGASVDALPTPRGLAVAPDGSRVFVASSALNQVLSVEPKHGGRIEVIAGTGRANVLDGALDAAAFAQPSGLAIDPDGRRLYVTDGDGSALRMIDLEAGWVSTLAGAAASQPWLDALFEFGFVDGEPPDSRLQHPLGLTLTPDRRRLLVADTLNGALREVSIDGLTIGPCALPAPPGGPIEPADVCATEDGRVFVADRRRGRVLMWNGSAWVAVH